MNERQQATQRLVAITQLAFDAIPRDPTRPEYRQDNILGDGYKHCLQGRDKFV